MTAANFGTSAPRLCPVRDGVPKRRARIELPRGEAHDRPHMRHTASARSRFSTASSISAGLL